MHDLAMSSIDSHFKTFHFQLIHLKLKHSSIYRAFIWFFFSVSCNQITHPVLSMVCQSLQKEKRRNKRNRSNVIFFFKLSLERRIVILTIDDSTHPNSHIVPVEQTHTAYTHTHINRHTRRKPIYDSIKEPTVPFSLLLSVQYIQLIPIHSLDYFPSHLNGIENKKNVKRKGSALPPHSHAHLYRQENRKKLVNL